MDWGCKARLGLPSAGHSWFLLAPMAAPQHSAVPDNQDGSGSGKVYLTEGKTCAVWERSRKNNSTASKVRKGRGEEVLQTRQRAMAWQCVLEEAAACGAAMQEQFLAGELMVELGKHMRGNEGQRGSHVSWSQPYTPFLYITSAPQHVIVLLPVRSFQQPTLKFRPNCAG